MVIHESIIQRQSALVGGKVADKRARKFNLQLISADIYYFMTTQGFALIIDADQESGG